MFLFGLELVIVRVIGVMVFIVGEFGIDSNLVVGQAAIGPHSGAEPNKPLHHEMKRFHSDD